ncbi:hypothetical protein ISS22_12240 [candidate division KSB1 bacterium]|nr:hypothetical protein [candidate division KSB1 bacterium]
MLIKFETYNDGEFWCARGIGDDVFTQGKTSGLFNSNVILLKAVIPACF